MLLLGDLNKEEVENDGCRSIEIYRTFENTNYTQI